MKPDENSLENDKALLDLNFIDCSYTEEAIEYREFKLQTKDFTIEINGINTIDISVGGFWSDVPNCKTIEDLKYLIKLFTK
jgi:hypothetical protein